MTLDRSGLRLLAACAAIAGLMAAPVLSHAQAATPKPAAKGAKSAASTTGAKSAKKAATPKAAEFSVPPASPEQLDAAERVYYGVYECEFNQTIQIVASAKHPSYVDIKHGKADYLMKPVLSSTGAIRLEDVRGETLMVQISAKSMLLNVKTARRLVDDCISPKQRELNEAARVDKAAAVAAAAAASAPASAPASSPASTPAAAASAATPTPAAAASAATPTPAAAAASDAAPAAAMGAASNASGAEAAAPK